VFESVRESKERERERERERARERERERELQQCNTHLRRHIGEAELDRHRAVLLAM
jgi:hypothetical protein